MRIFLLILFSSIIALLVDWYIYRRVIRRHNFHRFWRVGYIIYAVLVDTAVVSALIAYRSATDSDSPEMLRGIMWVIGFFFLNSIPKFIYTVVSLGDYLVQRERRTGGNYKISHIFGYSGAILAFCVGLLLLYSLTFGRSIIRVERVELEFADLPEAFDGLRVVEFSDLHMGTLIHRDRFLNRLVDSINLLKPDMVVQCGDIVNTHARELDEGAISILSRIQARYGVYAVMGNHDMGIYIHDTLRYPPAESVEEVVRVQQAIGWTVLQDSTVYISSRNGDSISVSGLNYPMDFKLNGHTKLMSRSDLPKTYEGLPDSTFNITLTHAPQLWDAILKERKADLTLAGHVHAMQIKLHIGKWAWSPAEFLYDRWSGLYEENGRYLYVNDGAGYVMFPMRVGTKPEVTLFVLKRKKKLDL